MGKATDMSDSAQVLRYFETVGYDDFSWVKDIALALDMPALRVSHAIDVLIAAGRIEEHRFTNRPIGFRLLPAPKCPMFDVSFPCVAVRRARSVKPANVDPARSARCAA